MVSTKESKLSLIPYPPRYLALRSSISSNLTIEVAELSASVLAEISSVMTDELKLSTACRSFSPDNCISLFIVLFQIVYAVRGKLQILGFKLLLLSSKLILEGLDTGKHIPPAQSVSQILSIRLFTSPVIVEEFWFWLLAILSNY